MCSTQLVHRYEVCVNVVGFNSDIQEYYEVTLLDDQKSLQQKTTETNQVASRWDRPSTAANSVIHPPRPVSISSAKCSASQAVVMT